MIQILNFPFGVRKTRRPRDQTPPWDCPKSSELNCHSELSKCQICYLRETGHVCIWPSNSQRAQHWAKRSSPKTILSWAPPTRCSTRIFTGIITPQALSSRFTDTPSEALSYATRSKSHRGEGTAKIPEDRNRELPHSWLRIMSLGPKNLQSDLKSLPIFPIPGASNSACPILTRSLGRGDNKGCRRPAASSRHTPWEGNTCVDLDF